LYWLDTTPFATIDFWQLSIPSIGRLLSYLGYIFTMIISTIQASVNDFAIQYDQGNLLILNQQKLPQEEEWIDVKTTEQMVEIIYSLKVRGAPLIGVSAAFALSQLAEQGASRQQIETAAVQLKNARPTAVNLSHCVDRVVAAMDQSTDFRQAIIDTALQIYHEDVALSSSMGKVGAELIEQGETILTICNTGSLAATGIGTALGVIRTAHAQGKKIHVYACETRPLLQGARLTAWELEKSGIPYTLICDSMAATLMRQGKIDRVLVGADRIAANGDFANKIGTYSLAVLAHHHQIPFHAVAPYTTIDRNCPDGARIQIEERSPDEVRGAKGSFGKVIWSPQNAPVYNPAFDVTPAELVTSYILDTGSFSPEEFAVE
jgi:methylthioribose-1-phosphate isomerase